jgi:predicted nucleic acid-binding protein
LIWVLVAIIVVLLCVVGFLAARQRRSAQLREGFGPEYDRVVQERGDQREAEAELRERRDRRREYDIRPLEESAREHYAERWEDTQRRFVDQPASAVAEADGLIGEVMRERGYPVEDFDQRAADLSVDHPEVVEHYRAAHALSVANGDQNASTEDLREAMVHYRALFADLLDDSARTEVKEIK